MFFTRGPFMKLIDTHAHLEDLENLGASIHRAEEAGVIAVITMGTDYESNRWVLEESSKHQTSKLRIYPAIGVHPWGLDASKLDVNVQFIEENVSKAIALGEIGLDYWYREARKSEEAKELQRMLFRKMLRIAEKTKKPVSIHSRGAWADCVDMTIEANIKKAVFHWFTGPLDVLEKIFDNGYYVSATPAVAYSKHLRTVIEHTPLEHLLLETDSPVLYQGTPSEPVHVLKALSGVAELKNEKLETIAEKTTENAKHFFSI